MQKKAQDVDADHTCREKEAIFFVFLEQMLVFIQHIPEYNIGDRRIKNRESTDRA